jgi:hypothetical protein
MSVVKEIIKKKMPGAEKYLQGWNDLSGEEREHFSKRYTKEELDGTSFIRCNLDETGNWRYPFDIPVIREPIIEKEERIFFTIRVCLGMLTVIGREPSEGRLVDDSIGVAKIRLVKDHQNENYQFCLTDDREVARVDAKVVMSREQLDDLWHEKMMAIILDRAGDLESAVDAESRVNERMFDNSRIMAAVMELSMGGSVETAVKVLKTGARI